jgi:cell division protein FtsW
MLISRSNSGVFARWWFTVDRGVLSATLLLMAAGILISMAASPPVAARIGLEPFHFVKNQLFYLAISVVVLLVVSFLDRPWIRRMSLLTFVGSLALMLAAWKFGPEIKGAHRWVDLGPFSLQPSELAKPAFVVTASWFLAERLRHPDMPGHWIAYGCAGAFIALLVAQPDFGQTALVIMTFGAMLLVYGMSWRIIFGLTGVIASLSVVAYALVPHVTSRVERFINPDSGDTFQVDTAIEAFRNGALMGAGPGGGTAKLVLPDANTDYVFAVVGEEFGVLACLAIMALFFFLVIRVLKRAKTEADPFVALSLAGLITMFGLQAAINMGVNVALLPAKGMTLPFISNGGSSLLGTALAIGIILALGRKLHGSDSHHLFALKPAA